MPLDPAYPRSAWPSCWRTRGAPVLLTEAALLGSPAGARRRRASSLDARSRPGSAARRSAGRAAAPAEAGAAGQPGLRDLHLGLDRAAQGGGDRRTAASRDLLGCERRLLGLGRRPTACCRCRLALPSTSRSGRSSWRSSPAAALVVVPRERRSRADGLAALLDDERSRPSSTLPPGRARHAGASPAPEACAGSLARVIVGGEALAPARCALARPPGRPGTASGQPLRPDRGHGRRAIGLRTADREPARRRRADRPADRRTRGPPARRARGEPVPVGVAGRALHRRRRPRARLPRPARADRRALRARSRSPRDPGARLYRTGDLARRLAGRRPRVPRPARPPGQGPRLPHRARARSRRRSPRHPGGRASAVVAARDGRAGGRRLVAYVVAARTAAAPSPARAARATCAARLPDHMVPAAFVLLAALPLTPNGKVDRRALPAPDEPAADSGRRRRRRRRARRSRSCSPGSGRGARASSGWAADDDFFDLGRPLAARRRGWSRACARRFGVELPLRELFEAPTVAGARRARSRRRAGGPGRRGGAAPRARPGRRGTGRLPLSFAQERLWFLDQLEPGSPAYNIPRRGRAQRPPRRRRPSAAALARAWSRRHEVLRTIFRVGGRRAAPAHPAARLRSPLPVVDLAALPPASAAAPRRQRLAARARAARFDLARGPLLARRSCAWSAERHRLLVVLHHIVSDGWSLGAPGARARSALRRLRWPAARRRCRSCRSSTPTSRSGSASGRRTRADGARLVAASGWPARSRRWSCRPTGRGRRCRPTRRARALRPPARPRRSAAALRPARTAPPCS